MSEQQAENQNEAVTEESTQDLLYGETEEPSESSQDESDSSEESKGEASKEDEQKEAEGSEGSKQDEELADSEKSLGLELPDETYADQSLVDEMELYAKAKGLSKEVAQELLDKRSNDLSNYRESVMEKHKEQVKEWEGELKADPNFGGENFDENIALAKSIMSKYGSEELMEDLNVSGYGSHPGILKLFSKVGKAMSNDSFEDGKSNVQKERSDNQIFYGEE